MGQTRMDVRQDNVEAYRQTMPGSGVSIERFTALVPPDGYYYVLKAGSVEGRFRSLRQAQTKYKELLDTSGYKPVAQNEGKTDPAQETVERYMDQLDAYWTDSHKHTRRGGKTMYRS